MSLFLPVLKAVLWPADVFVCLALIKMLQDDGKVQLDTGKYLEILKKDLRLVTVNFVYQNIYLTSKMLRYDAC